MILVSRLSSKQVLEKLSSLAMENLPEGLEGQLHLQYDEDDGVEIFFLEKEENPPSS